MDEFSVRARFCLFAFLVKWQQAQETIENEENFSYSDVNEIQAF